MLEISRRMVRESKVHGAVNGKENDYLLGFLDIMLIDDIFL